MATQDELSVALRYLPAKYKKAYADGKLDEEDIVEWGRRAGVLNQPEPAAPKPAARSLDSSKQEDKRSLVDSVADAAAAGLRRTGSGMVQQGIDADRLRQEQEAKPWYQRDVFDFVGFGPDERARADADIASHLEGFKKGETYGDIRKRMDSEATAAEQRVQQDVSSTSNPVARVAKQAVTDVANSPTSALSVFGGPLGAISGIDSYNRTYAQARDAGLDPDQAHKVAKEAQLVESTIGMVPAGKLLGPLENIGKSVVRGNLAKFAMRTGVHSAGEGINESLTEAAQMGLDYERSRTADSEKVRKYSETAAPADVAEGATRLFRTFMAGAAGGGALASPHTAFQISAENGKLAADMLSRHEELKGNRRKPGETLADLPVAADSVPVPTTPDMFGTPEGLPTREEYDAARQKSNEEDAAFSINRRQNEIEQRRQNAILGANQQLDVARQQVEALQERIESGNYSNADASALAAAQRRVRGLENAVGMLQRATPQQDAPQSNAIAPMNGEQLSLPGITAKQPQDAALEAAKKEAQSILTKQQKDREKAAKTSLGKARKSRITQLVKEAESLPENEREDHIAAGIAHFDSTTKLEDFLTKPAPAKQASTTTSAPKQTKPATPTTEELLKQLGPDVTLEQRAPGEPVSNLTADEVVKRIRGRIGTSAGNTAAKLIGDGNVMVVDDASQIPSTATQKTTAGFYDGKRTYVVANQLSEKNMMGNLLSVAAHEVKHAADDSGKVTLGGFIGAKANDQIVKKIEAQAKAGDKMAQEVVKAAKAGSTDATYSLELPAYYINFARAKRDLSGPGRRTANNIVSAVRVAAKNVIGSKDVNLEDVAYLSDQLLKKAADQGTPLNAENSGDLSMINGPEARGFRAAQGRGETYQSADGVEKFVTPDNGARFSTDVRAALQNAGQEGVDLEDILDHPEAFNQYPELRDVKVAAVDFTKKSTNGMYYPATQSIGLSNTLLNKGNRDQIMGTLLHEMQHWIQHRHPDRVRNFYDEDKVSTAEQKFVQQLHEKMKHELTQASQDVLDAGLSGADLDDPATANMINELMTNEDIPRSTRAYQMIHHVYGEDAFRDIAPYASEILDRFNEADNAFTEIDDEFGDVEDKLYQRYRDNHTEAEAFYTQNNFKKSSLPVNPEADNLLGRGRLEDGDGNVLASDGLEFNYDNVREAFERMKSPDNPVMKYLRRSLVAFGGIGRELGVMKENADGFAALRSHNAMNHFHEITRGIRNAAKVGVASGAFNSQEDGENTVRKEIERVMAVMQDEPDQGKRISLMNALVRKYPELAGFPRAVQEVNELSRTIARQLIESNPNMTEADRALIAKIMGNTFGYTTRMFAAFQGKEGRAYATRVRKEYDKAMKLVKNGKAIPPKLKESFDRWNNAAKYLIEHDLTIPDEDEISGVSTDRLTMLFDTWVGDAARVKANAKAAALADKRTKREADQAAREAMIAGLLDRRSDISGTEMQNMADNLIIGMLGLEEAGGPFASYYRGFKEDRGILNKREELPQEIKDLFGEITDPATRMAVTIAKQGELAGRQRLLLDMRDRGNGKWVVAAKDRGKEGNERFTVQLTGDGYGPLNGYYTTPEINAAISESLEMYSSFGDALAKSYQNSDAFVQASARKVVGGLVHLAGLQKLMTVVVDLYNMGTNFIGSPIALISNGIYNPKHWYGGASVAAQVIWDTAANGGVELSAATKDAIRYGMLDSARVQEIRRTPQHFVRQMISNQSKARRAATSGAKRGIRTGIEAFAMADAWVKIVAFQERVDTLKKFYAAEGIKKSDHEIKTEAADQMKDTNITYARTGALVRGAERIGLTTFMPYFVSVPRALAYNNIQAFKDMVTAVHASTPEGKMVMGMAAVRRMAGVQAGTFGIVYGMKALAAAINDEDEDKIAALQKLMFPDARFADSFYLGKDKDGIPLFARFSRVDPWGPVNDFMRILVDEHTSPEDKGRFMVDMFKDLMITNRVLVQAGKLAGDVLTDADIKSKETKWDRMTPKATAHVKKWLEDLPGLDYSDARSIMSLLDSFTPGIMDMFDPKNKGLAKPEEAGAETLANLITYSGGRLDRADPSLAAFTHGKTLEEIRKNGRKRQAEGMQAGVDINTLQSWFLDDAREEYDAMRDMADVWEGMTVGMEYGNSAASKIMKEDGKLKAEDIGNLRYGRLSIEAEQWISKYSRLISEDSQEKIMSGNDDRKLTPEEKQKLKDYLKNMKALGYKVQTE